ncbi:MAG: CDP-alcohol phosphatidyltransferase family protein [Bryobacterales bacterium]|nr:CDP-alcohol phosphatidyltransferase family protein [Bryobacterales bacterium]
MQTNDFQNAKRVQQSLLSGVEKKALIWMAERMPSFINSDHLTLVGLFAMVGAGAGYWLSGGNTAWLWMVNAMILLNWAGDSLDGTLARVRNRQRPRYGFYVDHVIDAVSAVLLLGGLALSGYMSAAVAIGLLVAFLLLAVESYLATYTLGTFRLSHGLFSPTELRLLLMIGNFALFTRTEATIFGGRYLLFDVGGVIGVAGMLLLFAWASIRNTTALYRQERLS